MKTIGLCFVAWLVIAFQLNAQVNPEIQAVQRILALHTAQIESLSRENTIQQKNISDLTLQLSDLSKKLADITQQRNQLQAANNIFASSATYKESQVAGLFHVYQTSPSRIFYPSNHHTHCSGNLCQTYGPNGPICNWPYN